MQANSYTHRLSKDLLQWMPVAAFEGEVIVVDKPEMVAEAAGLLAELKIENR